jgi:S1-C subfamily serine protease
VQNSRGQEEAEPAPGPGREKPWLGLIVHDRRTIEARRANEEAEEGVVVTHIAPGSVSEEKGIGLGDAILEVEGIRVSTVTDYQSLSQKFERWNRPVLVLIRKKGEVVTTFVALKNRN